MRSQPLKIPVCHRAKRQHGVRILSAPMSIFLKALAFLPPIRVTHEKFEVINSRGFLSLCFSGSAPPPPPPVRPTGNGNVNQGEWIHSSLHNNSNANVSPNAITNGNRGLSSGLAHSLPPSSHMKKTARGPGSRGEAEPTSERSMGDFITEGHLPELDEAGYICIP